MMTRKRYCEAIIRDCMYEHNVEDPKDLIPKIFSSSTMAIALQELGYINPIDTPTENAYTNSRGGIMKSSEQSYRYKHQLDTQYYSHSLHNEMSGRSNNTSQ